MHLAGNDPIKDEHNSFESDRGPNMPSLGCLSENFEGVQRSNEK